MNSQCRMENCPVVDRQMLGSNCGLLKLHAPGVVDVAKPGQFVMIYMPPEHRHMLPRPFSIFNIERSRGELEVLFEVIGRGTALLCGLLPGSNCKLLGPLGRGFPSPPAGSLFVAGGMGIAPLAFLAASTAVPRTLIYAGQTGTKLICPPVAMDLPNLTVVEATEDGSRGEMGSAADLLSRLLAESTAVFACGPREMLAAVARLCRQEDRQAWFSLEERMACGIGACLGCVVKTVDGYRRVCRDGPVFPAGEVILDE